MPVELPKRNTRTRPIALSVGVLAVSAIATLATLPKDDPAPRMQVVGVVAVRSADPSSTASRVPDPLELPKKKVAKKKKKAAPAASSGAATANVSSPVTSSGVASSGATASGATATRSSGATSSSGGSTKRSSGSSGTSAAEAEFGPG